MLTQLQLVLTSPQLPELRKRVVSAALGLGDTISSNQWSLGPSHDYESLENSTMVSSSLLRLPIERVDVNTLNAGDRTLVQSYVTMWTKLLEILQRHSSAYIANHKMIRDRLRAYHTAKDPDAAYDVLVRARPWSSLTFNDRRNGSRARNGRK